MSINSIIQFSIDSNIHFSKILTKKMMKKRLEVLQTLDTSDFVK